MILQYKRTGCYIVSVIILLFLQLTTLAQRQPPYMAPPLVGDSIKTGKVLAVQDTVFYNSSLKPYIVNPYTIDNIISLSINEFANKVIPDSFTVSVRVQENFVNISGTNGSRKDTLVISYSKNNPYRNKDTRLAKNYASAQVTVLGVSVSGGATQAAVMPLLKLENILVPNRTYTTDCSAITTISGSDTSVSTAGELSVSWAAVRFVPLYDLEWTFIDKAALDAGNYNTGGQLNPGLLFKNNASRITVANTSYRIPLLYDGEGSLFFRVRTVQYATNGELINSPWSSEASNSGLGRYNFTGHQRNLNWQATTSFAEEGKRKSVIQYFDGSLKGRQTVTKDNTTQTTVVAETYYDKQGRPAIQVLPSPTLSRLIQYTPNFNSINAAEYDKSQYDTLISVSDFCATSAPFMTTESGASQYYSAVNPSLNNAAEPAYNKFIPDAGMYPFTETRYTRDNTGRIDKQGGVGHQYQIGSSHETKYYYGTPAQEDLDALFGTEAGVASHYQKNMVRDANGQYSISYIDMSGHTVATALAGQSPANLTKLDSNLSFTQTDSLLSVTNNIIKDGSIQMNNSIIVPLEGDYNFHYKLNPESLGIADCSATTVCYDCLYDLTITVSDNCSNAPFSNAPYVITKSNFKLFKDDGITYNLDTTCKAADSLDLVFTLHLPEGNYDISKVLSISKESRDYYRDSIYTKHNTCKSYNQLVLEQMDSIRAHLSCSVDSATSYLTDAYREQMREDMRPLSGQYAGTDDQSPCFSIFSSGTKGYQTLHGYVDETGNPDFVMNSNGQWVAPENLSQEEFISNFKESWLDLLVTVHPEYQLLLEHEKIRGADTWEDDFLNTDTYAEALAKGYLNPTNSATYPANRFTVANGKPDSLVLYPATMSAAKISLENSLFNYIKITQTNTYYKLWNTATVTTECRDGKDAGCFNLWNDDTRSFNPTYMCEADLNMAWRMFRGAYLQIRNDWMDSYTRQQAGNLQSPILPCTAVFPDKNSIAQYTTGNANTENSYGGYTNSVSDTTQVKNNIQQYLYDNCKAYAVQWWEQLAPCGYTLQDSAVIIPYLINVCYEGADADHPFGSRFVKSSSTYRFRSFDAVINFYNDSAYHNSKDPFACNAYLITKPQGGNGNPSLIVNKPVLTTPDSCTCGVINARYSAFQTDAAKYGTFSNYMRLAYNTIISDADLTTLRNLCNNTSACRYLTAAITLPPSLQCNVGKTCVDCNRVLATKDGFTSQFPGKIPTKEESDTTQQKINTLFANFMNLQLGFNKSAYDYLSFLDSCPASSKSYNDYVQVPSTSITKPSEVSCERLTAVYKSFVADYPNPEKGDTVKVFVESPASQQNMRSTQSDAAADSASDSGSEVPAALAIDTRGQDTAATSGSNQMRNNSFRQMNSVSSASATGHYEYIFLSGKELMEWYFNNSLFLSDYTYDNFMDWLVNGCGYKVRQLPCNDTVAVSTDTLQTVLNQFNAKYGSQTSITETVVLPAHKITHVNQYYDGDGYVDTEVSYPSDAGLSAETWTSGGWFAVRDNVSFPFVRLPKNAVINDAKLNLYAKDVQIEYFPSVGAHFRYNYDSIYGSFQRIKSLVMPGVTRWSGVPDTESLHRITIPPITQDPNLIYGASDVYSREDFLNQPMTPLARDMYEVVESNKNYGLLFTINDYSLHYKSYNFWGITSVVPAGKQPNIAVNYTASRCDVFAAFVNNYLGTHLTPKQISDLYNKYGIQPDVCSQGYTGSGILLCDNRPEDSTIMLNFSPCKDTSFEAAEGAYYYLDINRQVLKNSFDQQYTGKCLNAVGLESFTVSHPLSEYQYTLYYYDEAGNLVKTIPPAGVHPIRNTAWLDNVKAARRSGSPLTPPHTLPTVYRYNSLNQVVSQLTPDGGVSQFWYDILGRLVISQNAQQKTESGYSYTLYDSLGRIKEVGKKLQPNTMTDAIARSQQQLQTWLNRVYFDGGTQIMAEDVTTTVYDIKNLQLSQATLPPSGYVVNPSFQKAYTLRNRVSYTQYYKRLAWNGSIVLYSNYDNSSTYSYDIHGNVDTLVLHYRLGMMAQHGYNQLKTVAYSYDLISGKVNGVHYQPGMTDQFYHRYEYDAENRITNVYTTDRKALIGLTGMEEQDARYFYYKHGPLAKAIIGQQQVQGLNYVYTLQGWLKAVNPDSTTEDPMVARSAYNYSLHYNNGDYTPIGTGTVGIVHAEWNTSGQAGFKSLYNGNIGAMAVNIKQLNKPLVYNYSYDQLNRLLTADAFTGWNGVSTFSPQLTSDYHEQLSYDANGNILSDTRNGTTTGGTQQAMDNLTYQYPKDVNGNITNNRLRYVYDGVNAGNYSNDIDNQTTLSLAAVNAERAPENSSDNYSYDAIGNLIKDVQGGISSVTWTVYGKIKTITKSDNSTITYGYDPAGNRISKAVTVNNITVTTWYVRDAQGNTLAVYNENAGTLKLTEQDIYGSSRLGIWNRNIDADQAVDPIVISASRGNKNYELTNHLGNVLVTLSDVRKQVVQNNVITGYTPVVVSASDYYSFGMQQPGRTSSSSSYRYSINGQEKETELNENITTAQFWEYDSRIGRRWNMDPQFKKYVEESPYLAFHNNPISVNDPTGDDPPKNFRKYSGAGGDLYLPKTATVETVSQGGQTSTQNRKTPITTRTGDVKAFNIGSQRFVAGYNPNGSFAGYYNYNTKEYYTNPDIAPLNGTINNVGMQVATHFTNTGQSSGAQAIQIAETKDKKLPIQEGLTAETHTTNGQTFTGFVDGGKYSPFAAPGQHGIEAVPGTPYFIGSGTNNGNSFNSGNVTTMNGGFILGMKDQPGDAVVIGTTNFQTIIVATNFYGSGQNVVMGVFDWGYKNGNQTRIGGINNYSTVTQKSLNTLKHDYPLYRLNQ